LQKVYAKLLLIKEEKVKILHVIALSAFAVLGLSGATQVYADERPLNGVSISPTSAELRLDAGEKYTGSLKVWNPGIEGITVQISVSPYTVTNETYDSDFETETTRTAISKWISIPEDRFQLDGGESKDVTYVVWVPKDAPSGGQYASIFASMLPYDAIDIQDGTGAQVISRISYKVYAQVSGDTKLSGKVSKISVSPFYFNPPISSSDVVENNGNVDFKAKHVITVKTFFGDKVVYTDEVENVILPEKARRTELKWEGAPALGIFKVTHDATITLGDTSDTETLTKTVIIIPLFLVVIIFLVLAVVVLKIVLVVRKHAAKKK
jgi:hypothetical protein